MARRADGRTRRGLLDGRGRGDASVCRRAWAEAGPLRRSPSRCPTPRARAEGFRYLLGLVDVGHRQALELADPDRPRFLRNPDSLAKWGAENADNQYLWARIRPDAALPHPRAARERLRLPDRDEGGLHAARRRRNFATLAAHELEIAPDGSFEILLSRETPPARGNWLAAPPGRALGAIRQYFWDWERESPARFAIERIEGEGEPPAPLTPARMAELLDEAGELDARRRARFWGEWVTQLRERLQPGRSRRRGASSAAPTTSSTATTGSGSAPDEALVIECELPDARYWHVQLCDVWFRTLDYATPPDQPERRAAARSTPTAACACVVAHRDPGVPNWLDTGGHPEGMIQYRYVWARSEAAAERAARALRSPARALPPGTPRVSPEERRRSDRRRQAHVQRREPAT